VTAGFTEGQSFIFRLEAAGTYVLKFYRQDFIRDYIINDFVQVIAGEASADSVLGRADRGRVIAEPRWPPPEGAAAASGPVASAQEPAAEPAAVVTAPPPAAVTRPRQTAPDDGIVAITPPQAVSPAAPSAASPTARAEVSAEAPPAIPGDAAPADYVRRARQEFDAGRVESALAILDAMRQRYPSGTDEAWWLYGQLLEANSPSRDIRLALEYYRRLVREYPQSLRASEAQRRIAYLERYYFNIR
jgi:TolA-binding protein